MACEDIDIQFHEEQTEIIEMNETKVKYFNRDFKKISSKMYDYNCNVKLIVGKETFKAHRDVLEQASDYFSAMFTHNMRERDDAVIELKQINPLGFSTMMEYFYHGYVVIDIPTIAGVLEAARFFHIGWLLGVCSHYLVCYLSLEDMAMVEELADEYMLGDLQSKIWSYFCAGFNQLTTRKRSMQLSLDVIITLLSEDRYIEATESVILRWIRRWVSHNATDRAAHLPELMSHIRFHLLSHEELASLPSDVLEVEGVADRVAQALEYRAAPHSQCLIDNPLTEARGSRDFIVAFSGIADEVLMHYKAPSTSSGFQMSNDVVADDNDDRTLPWLQEEVSTTDDLLDRQQQHEEKNEEDLNFESGEDSQAVNPSVGFLIERLESAANLGVIFEFSAVATLGNFLFVTGGYGRSSWCSSSLVYRYDPRCGTSPGAWLQLCSMTHARVSHALCAVPGQGLYAVAGIDHLVLDGMDRELILDAVEFYCPELDTWKPVRAMPFGCYNTGSTYSECDGKLYVTGGISDDQEHSVPVDFMRAYDPVADEWQPLPAMIVARHSHTLVEARGKLYAVGGYVANEEDTMGFLDCRQAEMYDIETGQWSLLGGLMPRELGHIYDYSTVHSGIIYVLGGKVREEFCLHSLDTAEGRGGAVKEGELIGAYVHKLVTLRVALPEQYLEELRLANHGVECGTVGVANDE